jgi:simple sugar transport system ATP-binding protein
MLGVESTSGPLLALDRGTARRRIVELSQQYGLRVDPDAIIEDLPVGVRQRVEILKTLYRHSNLLVLDEPSAVLTPQEIDDLFEVMRSLARGGTSIIFITHKLNEVLVIADRITVLRRGRVVGTTTPAATDEAELARMMVGRPVQLEVTKGPSKVGDEVLSLHGVTVRDDRHQVAVNSLDLSVRAGEIVAIAGVQGNGQTELVEAITGLRPVESGEIHIAGAPARADPRHVYSAGVGHVPEDRLEEGLVVGFTVAENMILNGYFHEPFSSGLALHREAMLSSAEELTREYDVRTPSVMNDIGNLSGGNQQKVIVAREFSRPLKLLVAAQPTRGLDVGSIEYIHKRIVAKRDEGTAVLIVSTELEEVLSLGDRIAVMFQGQIMGILDPSEATPERLGLLMGGAHPEEGVVPGEAAR